MNQLGAQQDYVAAKQALTEQKAKETDPKAKADLDIKLAMTLAIEAVNTRSEVKLVPEAREVLTPLLEKYEDPELAYTAGFIEEIAGNYPLAISYYDKAISLEPTNAKYMFQLGHTYELAGDLVQAKFWYDEASLANPDSEIVKIANAKVMWRQGDSEGAIAELKSIADGIEDSRMKAENYANIAILISKTTTDATQLSEALSFAEKAIATDPEFPLAYVAKGSVLLVQNTNLDQAYEALVYALTLNPQQAVANLRLAEVQFQLGEFNDGLENLKTFEAKIKEDITIMPADRLALKQEAAVDRFLVLLGVRAQTSQEPLHSVEDLYDLDSDISIALEEVEKIGDAKDQLITMLSVLNSENVESILGEDNQWLVFTAELYAPEVNEDNIFAENVTIEKIDPKDFLTTESDTDALLADYQELFFLRARLAHTFLNALPELADVIQEAQDSKTNESELLKDELEIYTELLKLQEKEGAEEELTEEELDAVQDLILVIIEDAEADPDRYDYANLYAVMADFQEVYGYKERALDYMQIAYEISDVERYQVRIAELKGEKMPTAEIKLTMSRQFLNDSENLPMTVAAFREEAMSPEEIMLARIYESVNSLYENPTSHETDSASQNELREEMFVIQLENVQNEILDALALFPASADLYALMADFQAKFGEIEDASEYMNFALVFEPENVHMLARSIVLSEDEAYQNETTKTLSQKVNEFSPEEKLLYLDAIDWDAYGVEKTILDAESVFENEDLKIDYYSLVVDFYDYKGNKEKAAEFINKRSDMIISIQA